jgi:hypothetical protein
VIRISSRRSEHALRIRGFRVGVSCNELCGVTLTGGIKIAGTTHVYKLRRVTRLLAAGKRVTLTLPAWSAGLRAMRAALRRHRGVTATINGTALDAAKNRGSATWTLTAVG